MTHKLYVWRSGLAQIDLKDNPTYDGTITVGSGSPEMLERCLVAGCRLMKDGSGYLVNCIPEAKNEDEALAALGRFKKIVDNVTSGKKAFEGI